MNCECLTEMNPPSPAWFSFNDRRSKPLPAAYVSSLGSNANQSAGAAPPRPTRGMLGRTIAMIVTNKRIEHSDRIFYRLEFLREVYADSRHRLGRVPPREAKRAGGGDLSTGHA